MPQTYKIAFWNLENLFAPDGHPSHEPKVYNQVKNDLAGWTDALFETKLTQLTRIITQLDPTVLGVCEVENSFVLEALVEKVRATTGRAYDVVHADSTRDRRGIDTAFLYDTGRIAFVPGTLFSHFVLRSTGTRDISQATFRTASGNDLILLANHWPSRSGGTELSRGYRMVAGETLGYWHKRIREETTEDAAILAMGDMNDDPFDESVSIHARASRERGDVERSRTAARFYNLTWNYMRQLCTDPTGATRLLHGTLYYQGDANAFDQIMVSKALLTAGQPFSVREETAKIEAIPEMVSTRVSPEPVRFGLPKGNAAANVNTAGFSDHYPVSVLIDEI
ncbi:endonuclease/exonuclease/phosphatase family protein [Thalassobaculum salexigens]|uniref:endonuclease/exonuclease/phosphatase family protein n=1 Tax=Thalassobaculum salexigens TaxID=455360 RepID=UPI00248E6508|nr:endonuclease/exonuclease/phosphatase family protein [Thalassobaculum salexigens]